MDGSFFWSRKGNADLAWRLYITGSNGVGLNAVTISWYNQFSAAVPISP